MILNDRFEIVRVAIADVAAGGDIGTAAATVDIATLFEVAQATAGQTLTLPAPSDTTRATVAFVVNVGSVSFGMYGLTIGAGQEGIFTFIDTLWTPLVAAAGDFWRSGVTQTLLPDGTTDVTEYIGRTGDVIVGAVGVPNSTLDVAGSFGASIAAQAADYTVVATDHTVRLTGAAIQTVTLPVAPHERRILTFVNETGFDHVVGSYFGLDGLAATEIPAKSTLTIQSDGTDWYMLGGSKLGVRIYRQVLNLAAGANVIAHNLALADPTVILDARLDSTGEFVTVSVTLEDVNDTTVFVPVALNGVRITIIGA